MKNQSRTIKTNLELWRVVMGSSGGHRKLPGGSDDFSLQTNRHCIIIYISSSPCHHHTCHHHHDKLSGRVQHNIIRRPGFFRILNSVNENAFMFSATIKHQTFQKCFHPITNKMAVSHYNNTALIKNITQTISLQHK